MQSMTDEGSGSASGGVESVEASPSSERLRAHLLPRWGEGVLAYSSRQVLAVTPS